MDINRLLSDELSYELRVRNLPVGNTVADKRVLLRNAFRIERSGFTPSYRPVELDVGLEIETCRRKLTDLARDIENFDLENRDNEYKRLYTRLVHVNGRLKRLPVSSEDERWGELSELSTWCLLLLERLTEIFSPDTVVTNAKEANDVNINNNILTNIPSSSHILDSPVPPLGAAVNVENPLVQQLQQLDLNGQPAEANRNDPEPEEDLIELGQPRSRRVSFGVQTSSADSLQYSVRAQPSAEELSPTNLVPIRHTNSTFLRNDFPAGARNQLSPSVVYVESQDRAVNVSGWNIHFDGETGSLFEFLQRVEEFRQSRGVSKDRLFKAAPELLRGTALHWFRSENISSWDELIKKLKSNFLPYDYEYALNEEIRKRSQGPQEKAIVFIASMQNLFNRLSNPPDEGTRVTLIRRNLLPYLQNALALQPVGTVEQLTRLCRSVEETSLRAHQYVPPTTNPRHLLEPQLAYRKPMNTSVPHQVNAVYHGGGESNFSTIPQAGTNRKTDCWNCDLPGHGFRTCSAPRQKFCFRCGHKGVTIKECPRCNTGNGRQSQRRTDA